MRQETVASNPSYHCESISNFRKMISEPTKQYFVAPDTVTGPNHAALGNVAIVSRWINEVNIWKRPHLYGGITNEYLDGDDVRKYIISPIEGPILLQLKKHNIVNNVYGTSALLTGNLVSAVHGRDNIQIYKLEPIFISCLNEPVSVPGSRSISGQILEPVSGSNPEIYIFGES